MTTKHEQERLYDRVLDQVAAEMRAQDAKWGEQNHENGTGPDRRPLRGLATYYEDQSLVTLNPVSVRADLLRDIARADCQRRGGPERPDTWTAILLEEVFEALAEDDPETLRAELIQSAAVCVQWVLAVDRAAAAAR